MKTKVLLFKDNKCVAPNYQIDGYYLKAPVNAKEVNGNLTFVDVRSLPIENVISQSTELIDSNAVFVIDDIKTGIFIKAVNSNAKISFYSEVYSEELIAFLTVNKFDLTIKYTCLAPERIQKLQANNVKVNGVFLKRFDEAEILKFWRLDYFTILPEIK